MGRDISQEIGHRQNTMAYKSTRKWDQMVLTSEFEVLSSTLAPFPMPAMTTDPNGVIRWASDCFAEFTGYSTEEMVGKSVEILESTNTPSLVEDGLQYVASSQPWEEKSVWRRKNGEAFTVWKAPIRDASGCIVLSLWTVTNRTRTEEERLPSAEQYSAIFSAMVEGVVLQTADGRIEVCNESAERILGLTPGQMVGRTSLDPRWAAVHEDGSPFPGETYPAMVTLRTGKPSSNVVMEVTSRGNFIQKPFSPEGLAGKVRAVLGQPVQGLGARILVVDDEADVRRFLRLVLEDGGYEVIEAADGKQALRQVREAPMDLVITDLVMPEQEGIETIQALQREVPGVAIIAISGAFGGHFLEVAQMMGANAVLSKPVGAELLLTTVTAVLQRIGA